MSNERETILSVRHLVKEFPLEGGRVLTAVADVSFDVRKGETFAIVGESGCGKSTLVKTLLNLHAPTSGEVLFHGEDITKLTGEALRQHYRNVQMVFQDPAAAFDPKMRIEEILAEPLENYGLLEKSERRQTVEELLLSVELPADFADRYPHNMSGGQRQRVAIARALALRPEIIVCDEATSALDVSVQDSVVRLLARLQRERGITYLFICHDLALVSLFAQRVLVMYLGSVMEMLDAARLQEARHPYTQALLSSVFPVDGAKVIPHTIRGEIPSASDRPKGCPFATRCERCTEICDEKAPSLREIAPGHFVACHNEKPCTER